MSDQRKYNKSIGYVVQSRRDCSNLVTINSDPIIH